MTPRLKYDHYKVLGVPRDADAGAIKRSYRALVKRTHPDRNASPLAAEAFLAIHDAYKVLNDETLRAAYDRVLAGYRPAPPAGAAGSTRNRRPNAPPPPAARDQDGVGPTWAFYGLHVTGLLFGVALVMGILFKIVFLDASPLIIVFASPGLAAIPESWAGLTMARRLPKPR